MFVNKSVCSGLRRLDFSTSICVFLIVSHLMFKSGYRTFEFNYLLNLKVVIFSSY